MKDAIRSMILGAVWASPGSIEEGWVDVLEECGIDPSVIQPTLEAGAPVADSSQHFFDTYFAGCEPENLVSAFWHASVALALVTPYGCHHFHFWFSETIRAFAPRWYEQSRDAQKPTLESGLYSIRQRLQDVFSLGINLRRHHVAEFAASLDALENDVSFRRPTDCAEPDLLWELSLAFSTASWKGRNIPGAVAFLQTRGESGTRAGKRLALLTAALYGDDYWRAELTELTTTSDQPMDSLEKLNLAENLLKKYSLEVDETVEGFVRTRRSE